MRSQPLRLLLGASLLLVAAATGAIGACSATNPNNGFTTTTGSGGAGGEPLISTGAGMGGDISGVTGAGGGVVTGGGDPKTCADAAASHTYIGCEFWPVPLDNIVWTIFDFAVVVANTGDQPADITVTRQGKTVGTAKVAPNGLGTIYLPWVPELRGAEPQGVPCSESSPLSATVKATGGAYHLVSTMPVTVYQFSAIEYKGEGGPPGKDWSSCPANDAFCQGLFPGCFSFTNDASLLLPSTAMTGNYRVTGQQGWVDAQSGPFAGPYFGVVGTAANTKVTVTLSPTSNLIGGGGVQSAGGGQTVSFNVNAGDVVEVIGDPASDFSGSLVQANNPIQVISGIACTQAPIGTPACDHIEESVLPAETFGKHYFVTPPTSPHGDVVGHLVRIYGNVDGTKLTYPGTKPSGAPGTINAGQVVDLGQVAQSFEITGDHEFAVGSFQLGAQLVDPNSPISMQEGDPAQSQMIAVEQFRIKYVFLAPADYDISFVDVIQPMGAQLMLDGSMVKTTPAPISSNFGINRIQLGPGNGGAHTLTGSAPFGIQVMGYGSYTSYQYPGGLNLDAIAPPPPPPK